MPELWLLYNQAVTWRARPSELVAIDDEYVAYCLDQAVFHVGTTIKSELESVEGKTDQELTAKRQAILNKYFSDEDTTARQYADPALFFSSQKE